MSDRRRCENPGSVSELWKEYCALKIERDRLHQRARRLAMSELQRTLFEYVKLEPVHNALDGKARQIAAARAGGCSEVDIKAMVLMDYLENSEGDLVHDLALSLCSAILEAPKSGEADRAAHALARKSPGRV